MRHFPLRLQEVLVVGESSAASESGDLEQTGRINIYSFNQTGLLNLYGINFEFFLVYDFVKFVIKKRRFNRLGQSFYDFTRKWWSKIKNIDGDFIFKKLEINNVNVKVRDLFSFVMYIRKWLEKQHLKL